MKICIESAGTAHSTKIYDKDSGTSIQARSVQVKIEAGCFTEALIEVVPVNFKGEIEVFSSMTLNEKQQVKAELIKVRKLSGSYISNEACYAISDKLDLLLDKYFKE